MQKTAVSTPQKERGLNYFKYEMKDTNQLLKNFISCAISETLTGSPENKQQIPNQDMFTETLCLRKLENGLPLDYLKKLTHKKPNSSDQLAKQHPKDSLKYEEELQNDQNQILKDFINESSFTAKRKKTGNNSIQDLILQKFYLDFSQNEEDEALKPSIQKYRNRDSQVNGYEKYDEVKQTKKQKKGLANISLRVKNIVSEHKKLTYKQVSDYVLQYSNDELDQLQPRQLFSNFSHRIKQVKNIKRRVYDALNVLVAVGILGKHQRCVCITEWTNVPGKRHSSEWTKINNKIEYLNKLKKSCADKSQALKLLVDKYCSITALRNKHLQDEKDQNAFQCENRKETAKTETTKDQPQNISLSKKLMFPVIVFCPAFDQGPSDKLTVQLEESSNQNESSENQFQAKKKVKISGKNITILGDFDCALEMDLQKYRNEEQQTKILQDIEDYAQQCAKQRVSHKHETEDFGEPSIEDYFNEQMFQSK